MNTFSIPSFALVHRFAHLIFTVIRGLGEGADSEKYVTFLKIIR